MFQKYAHAMGYLALLLVMLFMVAFQSLSVFSNYWLTYWTEDTLMKNISLGHTSEYEDRYVYYLVCYTIIGVIQGILNYVFNFLSYLKAQNMSVCQLNWLKCLLHQCFVFISICWEIICVN